MVNLDMLRVGAGLLERNRRLKLFANVTNSILILLAMLEMSANQHRHAAVA